MTRYQVAIRPSAAKELDALPDPVFDRLDFRIQSLAADPRPSGCKKLRGFKNLYRLRVGDYRVVYSVDDAEREIVVARVAHRSVAYDRDFQR
ncbi:MAG: type II toxin-antitoxin system RelE/ParE family toxin [Bryobacterales bacterium]|nr:type II toxin-antitoxin system RelE/ParE family toxin [Acidobacteriota bacterium]MCB9383492.1 type II toxin-antitoxin system RelE/ParE family toxin [Bryobacterales bacterium]